MSYAGAKFGKEMDPSVVSSVDVPGVSQRNKANADPKTRGKSTVTAPVQVDYAKWLAIFGVVIAGAFLLDIA